MCDLLGLAPNGCPYWKITTGTQAQLRRYGLAGEKGSVVVLVPAPIKTADIWDMAPSVSVVRRYVQAGCRVYLVIWPHPTRDYAASGLSDYAHSMLLACIDAVHADTGVERVFLTGHSIGGTIAALFAARHPERLRGLTLLGAPLRFGPDTGALGRLVSLAPDVRALIGDAEVIPGWLLNAFTAVASPQTFILSRAMDWLGSVGDPDRMRLHLLVERWTLNETALPQRLFVDVVERLYRQDAFAAGRLRIGGRAVSPGDIVAPVVCVTPRHCEVAPSEATLPVLETFGTRDREVLWYEGDRGVALQHLGMLVGPNAHRELWPRLIAWIRRH